MAIASTSRNCSIITLVDRGEMHGKEIRRLSTIPIIVSDRALIRKVDRVRPERRWIRRAGRCSSERRVKHLAHGLVARAFEQPKMTVNGSSMSCRSRSAPSVSA